MTIDKLEQYYGISSGIEAIEQEIATLYNPISSPAGKTDGSFSSTPGDPTARTAMRIIQLREKLEQERERLMDLAGTLRQIAAANGGSLHEAVAGNGSYNLIHG